MEDRSKRTAYQKGIEDALTRRSFRKQAGSTRKRRVRSQASGAGISPEYRMPVHRRAPGKTGMGSFQLYKRVLVPGERQQCEQMVLNGHREVGGPARQCRNKSVVGAKRCKPHGGTPRTPKASSGLLVALKLEEMPVLLCDR